MLAIGVALPPLKNDTWARKDFYFKVLSEDDFSLRRKRKNEVMPDGTLHLFLCVPMSVSYSPSSSSSSSSSSFLLRPPPLLCATSHIFWSPLSLSLSVSFGQIPPWLCDRRQANWPDEWRKRRRTGDRDGGRERKKQGNQKEGRSFLLLLLLLRLLFLSQREDV